MEKSELSVARQQLCAIAKNLNELGLNKGASGNVSVRVTNGFLVTPSGLPADLLITENMVAMQFDGSLAIDLNFGHQKPSSEWRFHRDILQHRPEVNAVVHTHSMFATSMACMHQSIPAFHYMIAISGGDSIRCAPYALFGSQALSDHALTALVDRKACLLANHGMIALGRDLDDALAVAVEVENLCEQYWRILQLGAPKLLTESEMREVFQQFKGYGQWDENKLN